MWLIIHNVQTRVNFLAYANSWMTNLYCIQIIGMAIYKFECMVAKYCIHGIQICITLLSGLATLCTNLYKGDGYTKFVCMVNIAFTVYKFV